MGVYDFFKGECPHCRGQIDTEEKGQKFGEIQTKAFINPLHLMDSFRKFYPGSLMPEQPPSQMRIGKTVCCRTPIIAVFEGKTLVKYIVDEETS